MQALLLSDQTDESAVLRLILQRAGFTVHAVTDLDHALEVWTDRPSDIILIALTTQKTELLHQVRLLRGQAVVPIVAITEAPSENHRADLLDAGADVVVPRPYTVRFLIAQMRALARRGTGVPLFGLPQMVREGIELDPATRSVQTGKGDPIRLTNLEFRLLYTLMTHAGQIIPTENLVEHVWGYSGEGSRDLVRGLVQRLRAKIEPHPHEPQFILTETGIGYTFRSEE